MAIRRLGRGRDGTDDMDLLLICQEVLKLVSGEDGDWVCRGPLPRALQQANPAAI